MSQDVSETSQKTQKWNIELGFKVFLLFIFAAILEIAGGWLVWKYIREKKNLWNLILGFVVLAIYGIVPCLQPLEDFGRTYACYGGVFIVCSYIWARLFDDGFHLDIGDYLGASVSLIGVFIALLWPRDGGGLQTSYVT